MNIRKLFPANPPAVGPVSNPAPAGEQVYLLGLNPCPWEVTDPQLRRAICKAHGTVLARKELRSKKRNRLVIRYDCPIYCPADLENRNERGYCKTGGWINEIFEDAP